MTSIVKRGRQIDLLLDVENNKGKKRESEVEGGRMNEHSNGWISMQMLRQQNLFDWKTRIKTQIHPRKFPSIPNGAYFSAIPRNNRSLDFRVWCIVSDHPSLSRNVFIFNFFFGVYIADLQTKKKLLLFNGHRRE